MADVFGSRLTLPSKCFRFRSGSVASSSSSMADSCRRCLFGRPDPDELQRDLQQHRQRLERQNVERWNYDFESGRPLFGRFDWQPIVVAKRKPESCGRRPPEENRSDDDDDIGDKRLELAKTSTYSDQTAVGTTTTPSEQLSIPSLTVASAAAVDGPYVPTLPRKAGRKRRRNTPGGDAGKLKQSRHSARRRTIVRRRAELVNTAGAARVTGEFPLTS